MGTESSDEHPKVRSDSGRRELRRWEDKALVGLMGLLILVLGFIWKAQAAQIDALANASNDHEKRITVAEKEVNGIQGWLQIINTRLNQALDGKPH